MPHRNEEERRQYHNRFHLSPILESWHSHVDTQHRSIPKANGSCSSCTSHDSSSSGSPGSIPTLPSIFSQSLSHQRTSELERKESFPEQFDIAYYRALQEAWLALDKYESLKLEYDYCAARLRDAEERWHIARHNVYWTHPLTFKHGIFDSLSGDFPSFTAMIEKRHSYMEQYLDQLDSDKDYSAAFLKRRDPGGETCKLGRPEGKTLKPPGDDLENRLCSKHRSERAMQENKRIYEGFARGDLVWNPWQCA